MKVLTRLLLTAPFAGVLILSCVKHDIQQCPATEEISYINHVRPIVIENCAVSGCHNGDNGADRNWTDFTKFQSHADEVRRRIRLPEDDPDHMPRVGDLTPAEIQTIVCWVDQGAQNN